MNEIVKLTILDGIAWVIFDNPPMNALGDEGKAVLLKTVEHLEEAKWDIHTVVFTGEGRAFIAGSDIRKFLELDSQSATKKSFKTKKIFEKIENFERPTIAAINGYCLGAGLELSLCCDIRIAADNAILGCPEVTLGIMPGVGATQRLPRLIGLGKSKELILTGRRIKAEEALAIGLVEKIAPADELRAEAKNMANGIGTKGPLAVAAAKKAINQGWDLNLKEGLALESKIWGSLFDTNDQKEGAKAFLEKREPVFKFR